MREHLLLDPFTAQREWTVDDIPVLSVEIFLPRPAERSDRVARRIDRYYQLYVRSYLRYCEQWLFPQAAEAYRTALTNSAPLPQDRAELRYQVTCNTGGILSLYTESKEFCGGKTERHRRGDTWDLAVGYPISLSACFPRHANWKKLLLERAQTEIQKQESAGVARYHDGWRKLLRRNFNPENFYLTEEALSFFYQMYAIAPAAEGVPVFSMPFDETICLFPPSRGKIEK